MAFKLGNIQIFSNTYYFDFMKWRKLTVGISVLLVIASFLVVGIKGINYSIDFLGGAEIQVNVLNPAVSADALRSAVVEAGIANAEITTTGVLSKKESSNSYLVRIQRKSGEDENKTTDKASRLVSVLKSHFGADKIQIASVTNISGKVGKEDAYKGYMALLFACVGILLYVAIRFDARFAPGAVLCLIHNVVIALGVMTLLDRPFTTASIAAFLTIVGYSINDTVIVYDRIRETRLLQPQLPMVTVVNRSISQTMNRTILTSTTGILALLVLSLLGGGTIEDFAITMLVGIVVGTYSSIYVAAPLTLMMDSVLNKFGFHAKNSAEQDKIPKGKDYAPPILIRKKTSGK